MSLTDAQAKRILDQFNLGSLVQLRNYCLLQLMAQEGLSVEQVLALSPNQLCFADEPARQSHEKLDQMIVLSGDLGQKMQKWLNRRPEQAEMLFCTTKTGKAITLAYVTHFFEQAVVDGELDEGVDLEQWYLYGLSQNEQAWEEYYMANTSNSKGEKSNPVKSRIDGNRERLPINVDRRQQAMETLRHRWQEIIEKRKHNK